MYVGSKLDYESADTNGNACYSLSINVSIRIKEDTEDTGLKI